VEKEMTLTSEQCELITEALRMASNYWHADKANRADEVSALIRTASIEPLAVANMVVMAGEIAFEAGWDAAMAHTHADGKHKYEAYKEFRKDNER